MTKTFVFSDKVTKKFLTKFQRNIFKYLRLAFDRSVEYKRVIRKGGVLRVVCKGEREERRSGYSGRRRSDDRPPGRRMKCLFCRWWLTPRGDRRDGGLFT